MDDHGPVPMDVHGYPWTTMVKSHVFRRGVSVCDWLIYDHLDNSGKTPKCSLFTL